jgi:hypothetical protein
MPVTVNLRDVKSIDSKATIKVFVTNNALDTAPVWEDATADYTARRAHAFSNKSKAAEKWAVSARYEIDANDATGEISISIIGTSIE